jgi:hypothetical protein
MASASGRRIIAESIYLTMNQVMKAATPSSITSA